MIFLFEEGRRELIMVKKNLALIPELKVLEEMLLSFGIGFLS